jgi:hypothetical protein
VTIRYPEDLDFADVFRARRHEDLDESRMRENRTSGLARGGGLETGHDSYCASPLLYDYPDHILRFRPEVTFVPKMIITEQCPMAYVVNLDEKSDLFRLSAA